MATDAARIELRTVMFLAGKFNGLLDNYGGFYQLDGVLELLEFANAYVLSDRVALGGAPSVGLGQISELIENLTHQDYSVEVIGHSQQYDFDLTPFEDRHRIDELQTRMKELDRYEPTHSAEWKSCFDEANTLEARAYILLADARGAAYVPDRIFGVKALEGYSEVLQQSHHLQDHDQFRRKLAEQLQTRPGDQAITTVVPSFLLEACRNAQTWQGVFSALRDIRNSDAAQRYRALALRSNSDIPKERREARVELARNGRFAFERETMPGGLNRWIVPTVALSSAAIAILFPAAAPIVGFVATVPPLIESIRGWQRERNNLFEFYNHSIGADLYVELKRIFPAIQFGPENLSHFLSERDFGWSKDLNWWEGFRSGNRSIQPDVGPS
jgi:hypothetical protein